MKYDGFNLTIARNLSCRLPKEGDVNADGTPIDGCDMVIVKAKDCPEYEKEGQLYIDPSNASAIKDMNGHSSTNLIYGCLKKRKADDYRGVIIGDERIFEEEYFTRNIYHTKLGRVYKTSHKMKDSPKSRAMFEIEQIEIKEKRSTNYPEKLAIQLKHDAITKVEHDERLTLHNQKFK